MVVHLIKLCVGIESIEHLATVQRRRLAACKAAGRPPMLFHRTRQTPRRRADLLAGGSLYWVIRGMIRVRQRLVDLKPITDENGIPRCLLCYDPLLIRTVNAPRRPFQGWRYLEAAAAPPDLPDWVEGEGAPPPEMAAELRELGLL